MTVREPTENERKRMIKEVRDVKSAVKKLRNWSVYDATPTSGMSLGGDSAHVDYGKQIAELKDEIVELRKTNDIVLKLLKEVLDK